MSEGHDNGADPGSILGGFHQDDSGLWVPEPEGKKVVMLMLEGGFNVSIDSESIEEVRDQINRFFLLRDEILDRAMDENQTEQEGDKTAGIWFEFRDPVYGETNLLHGNALQTKLVAIGYHWINLDDIRDAQKQQRLARANHRLQRGNARR